MTLKVKFIFPDRAEQDASGISDKLVELTQKIHDKIHDKNPRLLAHGIFGGQFGYGAHFENKTFLMHPYCWCEKAHCLWCSGCKCKPDGDCEYFLDGKQLANSGEWWAVNRAIVAPLPHEVAKEGTKKHRLAYRLFYKTIMERDRRLKQFWPAITHRCARKNMMVNAERQEGSGLPKTAPNFWDKHSGIKIWWYKWIGRDMKIHNPKNVSVRKAIEMAIRSLKKNE